MRKTPAAKAIGLAGLRARLDKAEIAYERACALSDRRNQIAAAACAAGKVSVCDEYRALAHQAGEHALGHSQRIRLLRQQIDQVHKAATRPLRVATTTPPSPSTESDVGRRKRIKRERLAAKDRRDAGLPPHDPRTAAGQREHTIEAMRGTRRARSLDYADLFGRRAAATPPRLAACECYETLVRTSQDGLFPQPSFEPRVDSSNISGRPEGNAAALLDVAALTAAVGREGVALLYLRIIENRSVTSLAAAGYGDESVAQTKFVAAVDGAALFFRLAPPTPKARPGSFGRAPANAWLGLETIS